MGHEPNMEHNSVFTELMASVGLGLLGRAIHVVRHDTRPFGWRLIVYETPIAIGFGIIGSGVAQYMKFDGMLANAVVVATGYIGPRVIDVLVDNLPAAIAKRLGSEEKKP